MLTSPITHSDMIIPTAARMLFLPASPITSPITFECYLQPLQDAEPKASGGLAANLVSTIRSFLPMAHKPDLNPAAGKKPVKVRLHTSYSVRMN